MKYILIAALLIGCSKEPMSSPAPPQVDSIVFTANMGFGSVQVVHNDSVLNGNDNLRGQYRYAAPLTTGKYGFHVVSVAPGFTTAYIHVKDSVKAIMERSHSSRIIQTLTYTK